jgi:hypothetical protein
MYGIPWFKLGLPNHAALTTCLPSNNKKTRHGPKVCCLDKSEITDIYLYALKVGHEIVLAFSTILKPGVLTV